MFLIRDEPRREWQEAEMSTIIHWAPPVGQALYRELHCHYFILSCRGRNYKVSHSTDEALWGLWRRSICPGLTHEWMAEPVFGPRTLSTWPPNCTAFLRPEYSSCSLVSAAIPASLGEFCLWKRLRAFQATGAPGIWRHLAEGTRHIQHYAVSHSVLFISKEELPLWNL